ncbi:class I SAM-dependent methyltransferase [Phenylobacterium sp. VNQ135]|uniref:class I SAM-dependent methyltransferase n=1 Tax=Phenylobacterium sp. VNQ135 TaxID=3400922 RepID=UPI003C0729E3
MEAQPTLLKRVDYDHAQHAAYAKGRALRPEAVQWYMDAFARHLPPKRPLVGVDLGSGTGRFTPALAEAFGGPVYGVEPSTRMRETAEAQAAHPNVRYLAGHAAAIPLPDAAADFVLMFLSFHHYPDREAAVREIARVLKPGGRAILRSTFKERIPDHWWRSYFPRSQQIEEAMFPTVAEARLYFEDRGFSTVAWETPTIPFEGDLEEAVAKLKLRAVSVFEHMTEAELDQGFAALDSALSAGTLQPKPTTGDYLVFARD